MRVTRLRRSIRGVPLVLAILVAVLAAPAGSETCGSVEPMPDEGHHHLVSGAQPPVPYRSTPPTSGWHFRERGEIRFGVFEPGAALSEAHQVSVLAVGGVVVTYRDLEPDELETLSEHVGAEADAGRPVALTSYEELEPGQVALTAWNLRQVCEGADLDAVAAFIDEHAAAEPDYGMGGHGEHGQHAAADDVVAAPDTGGIDGALVLLLGAAALAVVVAVGLALRSRPS